MNYYKLKKEFIFWEKRADDKETYNYRPEYHVEQVLYEGTPLALISFLLEYISPIENKIIYDLGCGYGRFILFGALNYKNTIFRGIDLVDERTYTAQYFSQQLNLNNAVFVNNNVLDIDLSDGDIFYLFNPFSSETLQQVIKKLRLLSEEKEIIILSVGPVTNILSDQDWLKTLFNNTFKFRGLDLYVTSIYSSRI